MFETYGVIEQNSLRLYIYRIAYDENVVLNNIHTGIKKWYSLNKGVQSNKLQTPQIILL